MSKCSSIIESMSGQRPWVLYQKWLLCSRANVWVIIFGHSKRGMKPLPSRFWIKFRWQQNLTFFCFNPFCLGYVYSVSLVWLHLYRLSSDPTQARLMRYLGNMTRSWMLTAQASMIIVSLNYHNITDPCPRTEIEENIHSCVFTCYYFDKTLSLLLLRPPSLPDLKVRPTQLIHLDPDVPTSAMIKGIVEYAELKSDLLNVLLDTKKTIGDTEKANILSDLVARAHIIHSSMQTVREIEHPPANNR